MQRVAQDCLAAWWQSQEFSPISLSADVLMESVLHVRRSTVSRGVQFVGLMSPGLTCLHQAPGDLSGMGPWRSPQAPVPVARSGRNTTFKNLSERLFAEVVANMKEVVVQGLFVAFSGKYLDDSFMAMSNSANPTSSR